MHLRRIGFPFALFFAVLTCLAALCAHGQEPAWTLTGPAFSASVEELRAASAKIPAEKFMEATVLFERDAYAFDAEGRVTYRHWIIYRIETQAGVDSWSETHSQWEPWYQNQPEIRARVISADGKVSTLDQKTITDGPANEDSEDTYTDARVRKAPLPGHGRGRHRGRRDHRHRQAALLFRRRNLSRRILAQRAHRSTANCSSTPPKKRSFNIASTCCPASRPPTR